MENEETQQIVCLYSIGSITKFKYGNKSIEYWLGIYICIKELLTTLEDNEIEVKIGSRCESIYNYPDKKHLILLLGNEVFSSFKTYIKKNKYKFKSFDLTMRSDSNINKNELNIIKDIFDINKSEKGILVCISDYPNYIRTNNKEIWVYFDNEITTAEFKYKDFQSSIVIFNKTLKEGYENQINEHFIIPDFLPNVSQNVFFHISCSINFETSDFLTRDNYEPLNEMLQLFEQSYINSQYATQIIKYFIENRNNSINTILNFVKNKFKNDKSINHFLEFIKKKSENGDSMNDIIEFLEDISKKSNLLKERFEIINKIERTKVSVYKD